MKKSFKFLSLIIFSTILCSKAYSQFAGGVTGEVTTSSVKITDTKDAAINVIKGNGITGYKGGVYMKLSIPASPIYVKPKFLISRQKGSVSLMYPEQTVTASFSVTRFEMPVLVGLKIIGPLSLEGGPVYNHLITSTKSFESSNIEIKPGGFGYRVGANADFGILGLNIAWQGIRNNSTSTLSSFETPNELIFGASFKFW